MLKRLLIISVLGVTLSGCFMAPMALIGPATSGFTTASIVQSGISTGASYIVKKSTGKSISEHVLESFEKNMEQTYLPNEKGIKKIPSMDLGRKINVGCKKFDFYCQRMELSKSESQVVVPKNIYKANVGCKKYDYYCKRMSNKILAPAFYLN